MNVLVTGMNGQLGSELQVLSDKSTLNFIFKSSADCDITDFAQVESVIEQNNIDAIINCAAYTAVDNAEDFQEDAHNVNHVGVKNLVEIAEKTKAKLIHISTDYVFDGEGNSPYKPSEEVAPIGVYGKSKRKGEKVILKSNAEAIIIRTSWLYSSFGNNFVKTMIRLGKERAELNVVSDQIGSPTYARDLAKACISILTNSERINQQGTVYHYSNKGEVSWCDFANTIFKLSGIDCVAHPIPTSSYPTKAKRPKYSVMDTSATAEDFNLKIDDWESALKRCLEELI